MQLQTELTGDPLQGLECSNRLVEVCSHYMLRRTSTVLKKYLPPKVQQVGQGKGGAQALRLVGCGREQAALGSVLDQRRQGRTPLGQHATLPSLNSVPSLMPATHPASQVIFCRMSPLQYELYKGFLGSEPVSAALAGRKLDKDAALATLPAITALKKLCCHPDLASALLGAGRASMQPLFWQLHRR